MTPTYKDHRTGRPRLWRGKLMCMAAGAVAALVGLTPWLVQVALSSPAQGLRWAPIGETVLLPFTRYGVVLLPSLVITGYGLAGLLVRAFAPHLAARSKISLVAGTSVVFVLSVAQTAVVITGQMTLQEFSTFTGTADLPLPLLLFIVVALGTITIGLLVFGLLASPRRHSALMGAALAAVAGGGWVSALALFWIGSTDDPADDLRNLQVLTSIIDLLPAVVTGAAIAWTRRRSLGWILTAAMGLTALWVLPVVPDAFALANRQGISATLPAFAALLPQFVLTLGRLLVVVTALMVATVSWWVSSRRDEDAQTRTSSG